MHTLLTVLVTAFLMWQFVHWIVWNGWYDVPSRPDPDKVGTGDPGAGDQ